MAEAVTATEASTHFFNSMDPDKARDERPAVQRFVEWFGVERPMGELDGVAVAAYAKRDGDGDTELEPLRAFLAYCARMVFTDQDLVPHLHLGRESAAAAALPGEAYQVTIEGVAALERELEELKGRRPEMAESLRIAMQDKDFRENAPLDAARDEQAHLEARIRQVEDRLHRAVIIDTGAKAGRANVGSTVKVLNLESESEQTFHLVSPSEVDPANGKISIESPVGAAMMNHAPGDEVTVKAPAGTVRLRMIEVTG